MSIPTRDELIARAIIADTSCCAHVLADFALAEIRRAVREELESLRNFTLRSEGWPIHTLHERISEEIDRRLAALAAGGMEQSRVVGESRAAAPDQEAHAEGQGRQSSLGAKMLVWDIERAASLTEPEILERAAEILKRHTDPLRTRVAAEVQACAELLRASAAAPAPDWAEKLAMEWYGSPLDARAKECAAFLRERLGPVVERAQSRAQAGFAEDVAALRKMEVGQ